MQEDAREGKSKPSLETKLAIIVESQATTLEIVVRTKVISPIIKTEKTTIEAVQGTDIIKRARRKDIIVRKAVTAVIIRRNVKIS